MEKMKNKKHIKLTYKCESCGKSFFTAQNLKIHIGHSHKSNQNYKCESCDKSFFKEQKLKLHIYIVHEGKTASKCELCGKMFLIEVSLKRHIKLAHEGNAPCQCELCGKSFLKARRLKLHLQKVHESYSYKCEKCDNTFSSLKSLKMHNRIDHGGNYKCEFCAQYFINEMGMNVHIAHVHKGHKNYINARKQRKQKHLLRNPQNTASKEEKKHKCNICNKYFIRQWYLTKHIESIHEGLKQYKCEYCEKSYGQSSELTYHNSRWHNIGEKFKCEFESCNNEFLKRTDLRYHIKRYHGYLFKCQQCDRECLEKRELNRHILKDHKVKCESCDKSYTISYINKHNSKVVYEAGKAKFKCQSCSYGEGKLQCKSCDKFYSKTHMVTSFKCKYCANDITRSKYLKILQHEGVVGKEKFKCSICNKLFTQFHGLKYHIKVMHEQKNYDQHIQKVNGKYECKICNTCYTQINNLKYHIIVVHEELEDINMSEDGTQSKYLKIVHEGGRGKGKCITPDRTDMEQIEASEINSDSNSTDDDEWQKYEEKWKKYLKDSTFYEPPNSRPNEIEPGEVVLENDVKDHFIASHSIIKTKTEENDHHENEFVNNVENDHEDDLENNHKYDCDLLDILASEDLPAGWQDMVDKDGHKFYLDQLHKPKTNEVEAGEIVIENDLQNGSENYHENYVRSNPEEVVIENGLNKDELLEILETEDLPEECEKMAVDHPQILQKEDLSMGDDLVESYSTIQIENPRTLQEGSPPKLKSKTEVKLLINGDSNNVNWINISKPPHDVTLNDIKLILKSNPKKYGMSNEIMYEYCVKTTDEDGDIGFKDIDDDNTILPLFGDKIVLKCWTKRSM